MIGIHKEVTFLPKIWINLRKQSDCGKKENLKELVLKSGLYRKPVYISDQMIQRNSKTGTESAVARKPKVTSELVMVCWQDWVN
mgnify:CR=1 FL=1